MRKNGRLFIILGVGLACLAVALAFLMFQNAGKGKAVENVPVQVQHRGGREGCASPPDPARCRSRRGAVDKDLLSGGEVFSRCDVLGLAPRAASSRVSASRSPSLKSPG